MRHLVLLLMSLSLGASWSVAETAAPEALPSPDTQELVRGIKEGINDSHFQPPIEVTDLLKAPSYTVNSWMVCIRSAQSDESKRITYSAFFKDKYVQSRYSVIADDCNQQQFHLFVEPTPIPPPSKVPAKKEASNDEQAISRLKANEERGGSLKLSRSAGGKIRIADAISSQLFLVGVTNRDGPFDLSCHGACRPALGGLHNLLLRPQVDERQNTRRVSAGPKPWTTVVLRPLGFTGLKHRRD